MKKIMPIIIFLLSIFVVKVNAVTANLDCPSTKYIINDTFSCKVTITPGTEELITSFKSNIAFPNDDLILTSITSNATNWISNSNTSLSFSNDNYTEGEGLTEELLLATLNFKVKNSTTYGNKTISLSGGNLTNSVNDSISIISTNNLLSNVTVTGKSFSFNPNINDYNIKGITSAAVNITATLADTRAHFENNHGSGIYTLNYGINTIQIIVVSESGKSNIYTFKITRLDNRSGNNYLSKLSISDGTLVPEFNKNTLVYDVSIPTTIDNLTVTASLEDSKASFVSNYGPRVVNLTNGSNSILIQVKAENGDTKTYTINVTKSDKKSNNYLKSIKLSSGTIEFKKDTLEYKVSVLNEIEEMEITATTEDSSAKIQVIGNKNLVVGENIYTIQVTAENESIRTYTIVVTRKEAGEKLSNNNYLKELLIKNHKIDFDKDVLSYNLTIKKENRLTLSYKPEDKAATVKVIGNSDLKDDSKIDIVVTAEDKTTKTYTINIKKSIDWATIGIIFGSLIVITGIVLLIVFKDKIFKTKEKTIKSDVLKGSRLVLGKATNDLKNEATKIYERKPELTVIPDIPDEVLEEPELYKEKGK